MYKPLETGGALLQHKPTAMKDRVVHILDTDIRNRSDTAYTPSVIHEAMLKFIPEERKTIRENFSCLFEDAAA